MHIFVITLMTDVCAFLTPSVTILSPIPPILFVFQKLHDRKAIDQSSQFCNSRLECNLLNSFLREVTSLFDWRSFPRTHLPLCTRHTFIISERKLCKTQGGMILTPPGTKCS